MFYVTQKRELTWPVIVNVPQDGGRTQAATCDGKFHVLTQTESEDAARAGTDLLDVQLIGWDRVKDESGQPVEFNGETKKQLLDITYVRIALFTAIAEFNNGKAARKND